MKDDQKVRPVAPPEFAAVSGLALLAGGSLEG